MSDEMMKLYKKAANSIVKAGVLPFPITDTLIEIMKSYMDDEEISFIAQAFKLKMSQTMDQLVKSTKGMDEATIDRLAKQIAKKGFMFNQPSSSGVMVYRLLPFVIIGAFENNFKKPAPTDPKELERWQRVSILYEKMLEELRDAIQGAYDNFLPIFQAQPPVDRTVPLSITAEGGTIPIEHSIGEIGEKVVLSKTVKEIIDKFDDIAVGHCFCRNYRSMLGHACSSNAPMEVCFTFGKSARFVIEEGFSRRVSKEEAREILQRAEEAGLVHKAFHNKSDVTAEENSICNCCSDCCDSFTLWRAGATPMVNYSSYLARVNQETCTACGTCEIKCPVEAIAVDGDTAVVNDARCIGCGVCAHFCPETAISLMEKPRTVFLPPPRLGA